MTEHGTRSGSAGESAVLLSEIDPQMSAPMPTGITELDRVLAGGLVPGSVTLLGGEPGIGKSTLVLQALAAVASRGARTLLVAAEESAEQVRRRAERLGALIEGCFVVATGELPAALEAIGRVEPDLVVVDSIQAIGDSTLAAQAGSPTQVRECAAALAAYAKATATSVVLVGHVTKDGSLAGPRTLEHLVDTVLSFEGDRHYALRLLASVKHRYGPTGEVGLFEMGEDGLVSLDDPSSLLLRDRRPDTAGTVVVPVVSGRRPLLVELQALVTEGWGGSPRRVVEGVASSRCALMLAVIERCLGVPTGLFDVFVSTVGGIKIDEPAADLPLALGIVSAITGCPIPHDVVAFGEVGLTGEIRHTARGDRRLAEAARLGFAAAIAPSETPDGAPGFDVRRVGTLAEAVERAGLSIARLGTSIPSLANSGPSTGLPIPSPASPAGNAGRGSSARRRHSLMSEGPVAPHPSALDTVSKWSGVEQFGIPVP
jgi:DNA repair protein RadA/Sms